MEKDNMTFSKKLYYAIHKTPDERTLLDDYSFAKFHWIEFDGGVIQQVKRFNIGSSVKTVADLKNTFSKYSQSKVVRVFRKVILRPEASGYKEEEMRK